MRHDFMGVVILESLEDQSILQEVIVLRESVILAPPDDPYPIWSRNLVLIPSDDIDLFAARLSMVMKEDFYNHFVDDHQVIVVFKNKYFVLNKYDKSTWNEMIEYGKTVRVGPEWTENIPVEEDNLLA